MLLINGLCLIPCDAEIYERGPSPSPFPLAFCNKDGVFIRGGLEFGVLVASDVVPLRAGRVSSF